MAIYPVILCGGAGTRLWPASRPTMPKQFLALAGKQSLFQDTASRVAPLVTRDARLIVIAGRAHRSFIERQLAELDLSADLLLEPEGRDSAPAMAAAAIWIAARDPEGVALFVASDHHVPDGEAFRHAALVAAPTAAQGRIVTFGVHPTEPSSAYGYIAPQGEGLSPVRAFVEKPDRDTALTYLDQGYLWNSGNFMVAAQTLIEELEAHDPQIVSAVRAALPDQARGGAVLLGEAFRGAPKISIDYAVMEKSDRVSVLPVDFAWSDLGAWDAVKATGQGDSGLIIGDGEGNLVRAAPGMAVAISGVEGLAVVAEPDAVLVCRLDQAQSVKTLVEKIKTISPSHAHGPISASGDLEAEAARLSSWMTLSALPLWATLGVARDGGAIELLDDAGHSAADYRRARVQGRQAFVFAAAGHAGWRGPWREVVIGILDRYEQTNRRADGLLRTLVAEAGETLDDTASLYDQAFYLLATAASAKAGLEPERMRDRANLLWLAIQTLKLPNRGWRDDVGQPYQANAHMHLLEAMLAWDEVEPNSQWREAAGQIVSLAHDAFFDDRGALREFFNADWSVAEGEAGGLLEPGHQFEWAWLMARWAGLTSDDTALAAARALYAVGRAGVDPVRGVALDDMNIDFSRHSQRARLWPQTERLKAALILSETTEGGEREALREDAVETLAGLSLYLKPSGLWFDKMEADGKLTDEPAPASSFYHIAAAWLQLRDTLNL